MDDLVLWEAAARATLVGAGLREAARADRKELQTIANGLKDRADELQACVAPDAAACLKGMVATVVGNRRIVVVPDPTTLPVDQIKVGPRCRVVMGDLDGLADSIRRRGQLSSVTLSPFGRLVAGGRRLAALRLAGKATAVVNVVAGLEDARRALMAEREENTCREPLTPEEAVALGKVLEDHLRPLARERQARAGGCKSRPGNGNSALGKLPRALSEGASGGRIRDVVAEAVGMSPRTYAEAREVVEAAEADPALRPVVDEMNASGKVHAAHRKARGARAPAGKEGAARSGLLRAWGRAGAKERRAFVRLLAGELRPLLA